MVVLSERYGGRARRSIGKRTAIYVTAFGLGSLVVAAGLSLAMVGIADGMLPKPAQSASPTSTPALEKPGSKKKTSPKFPLPRKRSKPAKSEGERSGKNAPPSKAPSKRLGQREPDSKASRSRANEMTPRTKSQAL